MSRTGMRPLSEYEQMCLECVHNLIDDGVIGREALRTTEDANFKAMWEELYVEAWTYSDNHAVRDRMDKIAARQPGAQPIRAVNTTNPHQLEG